MGVTDKVLCKGSVSERIGEELLLGEVVIDGHVSCVEVLSRVDR